MPEIFMWLSLYLYVSGMIAFGMIVSEAHRPNLARIFLGLVFWPVVVPAVFLWGIVNA